MLMVMFKYKRDSSEGDIAEQAEDVTVEVTRFTRGSVVCDFKVTHVSPSSLTANNFIKFIFLIFTFFMLTIFFISR